MAISVIANSATRTLEVKVRDKLTREDLARLRPSVERLIKACGKIRVLFNMEDFHGWRTSSVWEDIKFDLSHHDDIERLAMVGDRQWEKWMAAFCKVFTTADIRYFDEAELGRARHWVAA